MLSDNSTVCWHHRCGSFIAAQTGSENNHILEVHFLLYKKAFIDLFQAILIDLNRACLIQIRLCTNELCGNSIGVVLFQVFLGNTCL